MKRLVYSCILLSLLIPVSNCFAQASLTVTNRFYDSQSNSGTKGNYTISLLDDSFSSPISLSSGNSYLIAIPSYLYFHSQFPEYDNTGLQGLVDPDYLFNSWDHLVQNFQFTNNEYIQVGDIHHEAIFYNSRPADLHVSGEGNIVDMAPLDVCNPWKIIQGATSNKYDQFTDFYTTTNEVERQFDYSVVHGVHMQQYPDPNDASKPYYSLKAAKYLTNGGTAVTLYPTYPLSAADLIFHHWETTNTAIVTDPHRSSNSDYDIKAAIFSDNINPAII